MTNRPTARILGLLALSLAVLLLGLAPARGEGLGGSWSVRGTHATLGAYSGTLKVEEDAGQGTFSFSAEATTDRGEKLAWRGTGRRSGSAVFTRFTLRAPGIVGALDGAARAEPCRGSYRIGADGRTLSGRWWSEADPARRATETLTLGDATPSLDGLLVLVDGNGADVTGVKKTTDGVLLRVNLDDDDQDGGRGGDGELEIVPDKDDRDGVNGENDLLPFKLARPATCPQGATLAISFGPRLAVWKSATKAAGTRVESGTKLPAAATTLYLEGLSPSEPGAPETLEVTLEANGRAIGTDRGRVHVARPAFLLSGHSASAPSTDALVRRAADRRRDPIFIRGKDASGKAVAWTVHAFNTEKGAKIALSTEGAVVAYHGHSNFGLGYAFATGFTSVRQFMNIAEPQVPVNWEYLRDHQEHPGLMFADDEYGDDSTTSTFSDPVEVAATVRGTLASYENTRYPLDGGNGTRLRLTRGRVKWQDRHTGQPGDARIVVKAGSRDMPAKRWSKLYLRSCYSGPYYFDSFGGRGTFFYTHDEVSSTTSAALFIECCIDGRSDAETLRALNRDQNVHDYHVFGG